MNNLINLTINDEQIQANRDETIWEVASRLSIEIPHLCHKPADSYRPDGNCRACMVEINGERTLAASCIRKVSEGMVVKTESERAEKESAENGARVTRDRPTLPGGCSRSRFYALALCK